MTMSSASTDATAPDLADPADVVAAEIDQHEVLGALLRIGLSSRFEGVDPRPASCRARAGTMIGRTSASPSWTGPGPGTDDLQTDAKSKKYMYGDGFSAAQRAIDIQRAGCQIHAHALVTTPPASRHRPECSP